MIFNFSAMSENKSYSYFEHLLFPPIRCDEKKLARAVNGKKILITGASFGIGEQITYKLAKTGAKLILVARTAEKLEEIKNNIERENSHSDIITYAVDLTKENEIEELVSKLSGQDEGIDIFISNAGKSIRRPIFESLDRFHDSQRTMALNHFAPARLTLALIPSLKEKRGQIINISAVNVLLIAAPFWSAYQASKTAFDQWFRCAAPELEAAGITATSIYLPLVKTRMIEPTKAYKNAPAMSPEHVAKIVCRAIYSRKKIFKPWWLIFGQLGAIVFRRPAEILMNRLIKRRNKKLAE